MPSSVSEAATTVAGMSDMVVTDEAGRWPPAVERRAQAWVASARPEEGVGSRHHIVPVMYLRHFADNDQLLVRRIPEHTPLLCNIRDLAQRDFYTVLADDPDTGEPQPDARIEQALQLVEGAAAQVLRMLRVRNELELPI
jgi:hypothetical protein